MTKLEVLEFVKKNPIFYLATSSNNIPHVRTMTVCRAEKDGIIFNTKRFKDSYREIANNSNIEMCFYSTKKDIQIRIFGKVQIIESLDLKKEIVTKFPILQSIVNEKGYEVIVPCRLKNWDFKIWDRNRLHSKKSIECS